MPLTKAEVEDIAADVVAACRSDVNKEIAKLHEQDRANAWTEARAIALAEAASDLAVKKITDNFYKSVGKKTIAVIGAAVVGLGLYLSEEFKKWTGMH